MATMAAPSIHHTDVTVQEERVATPELCAEDRALIRGSVLFSVLCLALMGAIGLWLWYGIQHYQNCF